jgi:DNA-binding SARP family transcriptional activator
MNVSVLGPLAATQGGVSIVPSAAKPRALLALLAAYSGRVIPIDVIVAELWENSPPPSATTTIQTYILQLRRLIRACTGPYVDAKRVLRTEAGGYLLNQADGVFDAAEHERLAARGYEAIQAGDFREARNRLQSALDLWRGPAFVDVQTGGRLSAQATLLEESRRTVLERRVQADLQLGRHHELLGELAGLTAEHPTDERLHAHYMVALYRSDRRSQALNIFSGLRSALADELGLDPSPNITRLRQAILLADPELDRKGLRPLVAR